MAVRSTELQVFGLAKYWAVKLIVPSTAATARPNDGTTRQFECKRSEILGDVHALLKKKKKTSKSSVIIRNGPDAVLLL